jgi:hypothetical protein
LKPKQDTRNVGRSVVKSSEGKKISRNSNLTKSYNEFQTNKTMMKSNSNLISPNVVVE